MASPLPHPGRTLGHYRILEQIGAGGMGVVFRARDERLERDVALKVLPPGTLADEAARSRFRQEALSLSRLNHPNIATVHDFDTHDGIDCLITEFIPGKTLDTTVAAGGTPEKNIIQIGVQLADGLETAHRAGVVHRDLKPGNLRLTDDGRLKILDFGLAKRIDASDQTTITQSVVEQGMAGTLPYMAPEQLLGDKIDARTDLWAAGVVLYELSTGRLPFEGKTTPALADEILHRAPTPPQNIRPQISERLADVILKCLEKDPENRYQSAKELAVDLRRLGALSTAVAPPARSKQRSASAMRWRVILPAVLLAAAALAAAAFLWLRSSDYFWRNPIRDARFQPITDFAGLEESAAISRDGRFVAFLSDHDGQMDLWVTQVGSGQFHNLTHGTVPDIVNQLIRNVGFSPDGSLVTYWARRHRGTGAEDISIWAVPTLGGQPRPYLEGVAEFDWSRDGSRLAYHTPGPGDPLYVSDGSVRPESRPIFKAPSGMHSHFPLWAPDASYIYVVEGVIPDKLDIWRLPPGGGTPQRMTSQVARVTYPVFLDRHTLLYLATDRDGSGPWLYGMDVDRRIPHRLSSGLDRYTSLAASADGRHVVATLATPQRTLWRLPITDSAAPASAATRVSLTTTTGFSPRLGPDYLLYISATGSSESIWKLARGTGTELWRGEGARIVGGPAVSPDGHRIAFSVRQSGRSLLYVMQADGTDVRALTDSLELQGDPAWAPDGDSIISAADDHGTPHLFRVPAGGGSPAPLGQEYALDPVWAPDGSFVVYSGPDIGTTFGVRAVTPQAAPHSLPPLTLTRGARHLAFLPGKRALIVLQGDIQHKNLWLVDLDTGAQRPLTDFPPDFNIRDFDVSPDGRELVVERTQESSNVVLLDLPQR